MVQQCLISEAGASKIGSGVAAIRVNGYRNMNVTPCPALVSILHRAVEHDSSDVHLVPGYPATYRVHGNLRTLEEGVVSRGDVEEMVRSILPEQLWADEGLKNHDCSLSLSHDGLTCRFRANVYLSQGDWCLCLRHIPNEIPSLDWLGFSEELAKRLVSYHNGLVVVTGVTGSGKSASLAALINLIRQDPTRRVLTVEEPIEYVYPPGRGAIVTQREVGRDVGSFADGLKFGLRQDPDVILVGEIRDRETAQMALSAAETGHLILTTLHTRDAKGAISRLVDLFPQDTQEDIRKQLAMSLRSVVCQHLLPTASGSEKRALALEVLHVTQQVQVSIRSGKLETIDSAIQTGKRDGMVMLDDDLQRLVSAGKVGIEVARRFAKDASQLQGGARAWGV